MRGLRIFEIVVVIIAILLGLLGVDRYTLTIVVLGALSITSYCEIKGGFR